MIHSIPSRYGRAAATVGALLTACCVAFAAAGADYSSSGAPSQPHSVYGDDPDTTRGRVNWGNLMNWGTHQYVYCRSESGNAKVVYYSALFDAGTDKDETNLAADYSSPFARSLASRNFGVLSVPACTDNHDKYLIQARLKRERYADTIKGLTIETTRWKPSQAIIIQP